MKYKLRFYKKCLFAVTLLFMASTQTKAQFTTTKSFIPDTLSVLRNPCTGWVIYCEGWKFENTWRSIYPQVNAVNIWKQMDAIKADKYATHIYIRILWSALEPEDGKYTWKHNKDYIQFIEEAKKRKLKLTFRVYCSTKSRTEEGTPKYVFDADAGYSWDHGTRNGKVYQLRDAYMDDPIFLKKIETFVQAFAKEYDNPDVTDYVDAFGAGWWGEGHHNNIKDKDNLPMIIDKITGFYYKNFKNIITVYNLAHKHPDPTVVCDFELAKELVYEQRGFIPRRDGLGSHWFSRGDRDMMQNYFSPNAPLIGEGCYWISNPVEKQDPKSNVDTRFAMKDWPITLKKGLDDALNFHANTFDLRVPKEAKIWIEEMPDQVQRSITQGGYRLMPENVTFSNSTQSGGKIQVTHTWKNSGGGVPSVDFGVEVARLEMAAERAMKSDNPVSGQIWFSMDGVHPGEAGHKLYSDIFERSFSQMKNFAEANVHQTPEALHQLNWETVALLPITEAKLSKGWRIVDSKMDTIYNEGHKRTDAMLRGAITCSKAGESVKIKWKGTTLGFSDIPTRNVCKIEITVAKGKPSILERKQVDRKYKSDFFYLPQLAFGEHTATIKIMELPDNTGYYLGQVLVVGDVLK